MFSKIATIHTLSDTKLLAFFINDDPRIYDVAPLMDSHPAFKPLHDPNLFKQVKVDAGGYGISWSDDIDLSSDEIHDHGFAVKVIAREVERVVDSTKEARLAACVSQSQLGDATGLKQPVIARLEAGKTIPRLDTLLRLLAPLGKTLKVVDLADA